MTAFRRLLLALLLLFLCPGLPGCLRPDPPPDGPWAYLSGRFLRGVSAPLLILPAPLLSLSSMPHLLPAIMLRDHYTTCAEKEAAHSAIYFSSRGLPI